VEEVTIFTKRHCSAGVFALVQKVDRYVQISGSQPFWSRTTFFKKNPMDHFATLTHYEQLVETFQERFIKNLWNSRWTTGNSGWTNGGPRGLR